MQTLTDLFERYAQQLPLELFVLVGSFIEELFSPIPSFVVLIPAGAVASAQNIALWYIAVLAVLSAIGRLAGAIILYWLADKFEDKALANGRRLFGLTHEHVENIGQRLSKYRHKEWLALFLMHALPIFPVAALSLSCGFIRVRYRIFILTTFFGTIVNAIIYLLIGYGGHHAAQTAHAIDYASRIVLAIIVVVVAWWLIRRKVVSRSNR